MTLMKMTERWKDKNCHNMHVPTVAFMTHQQWSFAMLPANGSVMAEETLQEGMHSSMAEVYA